MQELAVGIFLLLGVAQNCIALRQDTQDTKSLEQTTKIQKQLTRIQKQPEF